MKREISTKTLRENFKILIEHKSDDDTKCSALGTIPKGLFKGQKDLEIRGRVETIQTLAILRSNGILRKILDTSSTQLLFSHSNSSGKPSANAQKLSKNNNNNNNNNNNVLLVRISLTFSRYSSLLSIAPSRASRLHPVSGTDLL